MRCLSCNIILTDFEATRKYESSGAYIDMCLNCFSKADMADVLVIDRADLLNEVNQVPDDDAELFEEDCNGIDCC